MKTDFKFSNLLGTVYCQGNLVFSPDGTHLYSPVGNRVTVFNLVENKSYTLPFTHRTNIAHLGLTPRGNLLLTIDDAGQAILTNVLRRIPIYHFSFRGKVSALAFSPSGRYFAVGIERKTEVWKVPSTPDANEDGGLEFSPFVRVLSLAGHFDTVQHISWSSDSRFFLTSSKDLTTRIWSVEKVEGFNKTVLTGHRQGVVAAWFDKGQDTVWTVSKDGALFEWQYRKYIFREGDGVDKMIMEAGENDEDSSDDDDDDDRRWRTVNRHYFMQSHANLRCAAYHAATNMLVAGFSTGTFVLYELPSFSLVHSFQMAESNVDHVTINESGEWLAFGAARLGQLLVWEWQSESYILKQQGHHDAMNALTYSPDGQRIVTTADDGRVKVWDVESGFCLVTFSEHTSAVTACAFAPRGNVLFTASLDGSVRAWDLKRYRNFRTFTAPTQLPFSCLAVDPSGEVVAAASHSTASFDIHLWSVQTGQLLDRLAGHEGPVASLAFTADSTALVSGSFDHTARIWSVFARTQTSEPLQLQADVLDVAVRPDAKQLAVSTLDGQLTFWSIEDAVQVAGVDGRRDVSGGRKFSDRRTAANSTGNKFFSTIQYSTDGTCLLAAGNSKYICLYAVATGVLLKKYTVSVNLSLSGTQEFLNSRLLTEAGPLAEIDTVGEAEDREDRRDKRLPGVRRGNDPSARRLQPAEVRVSGVAFSPTGMAFCAATTEGLLVYSLDGAVPFDPFDLSIDITPAATLSVLRGVDGAEPDYLTALVMAFRLNDQTLLQRVFFAVPHAVVPHVVASLPTVYVARLLRFVAAQTEQSPHIEFCLLWIKALVDRHGPWLTAHRGKLDVELRVVVRAMGRMRDDIRRLADDNVYAVDYLLQQAAQAKVQAQKQQLQLEAAKQESRDLVEAFD